ncbi:MAG TPA: TIM barrel protein [Ktedonobacteraceae bacterium]|nr:TIM barrel protein [Ktedonobacteraceae bacterium]
MIRISAFADEISPDLDEQVAVLTRENIHYLDLRSAWNINVLDLNDEQVKHIQQTLQEHHIEVAAIGSPIGKVPIDSPFEAEVQRLERAIAVAHAFHTPYIRIFSFYPPATGGDVAAHRDEVMRRMRVMGERAREAAITLLHENEKDIYGDTIARCVDLMREDAGSGHVQTVFDPANFIQCGQTPFPDAYDALQPWLAYMHVKDALPDGRVVTAGEGSARWPALLQRLRVDGYEGFFALEPHLAAQGQLGGFSGPDLFHHAAQALRTMLQGMGWDYP